MNIINILRSTNSSLDKERILRACVGETERQVFYHAYNPELTYGLNYGNVPDTECKDYDSMFELLHHLSIRSLSGNAARAAVDSFAAKNGNLIKAICNKDLDCGVTATTLNKVFGKDFIPVFKVQLATEVPLDKVSYPCVAQIKYNGVRVIAMVRNGEVTFKTRNGKTFEFPALARYLENSCSPGYILDGELCIGDSQGLDHTSVSGIVNSAIHGTPIRNDKIVFNVFDCMPLNDFIANKCDIPYLGRASLLYVTVARGGLVHFAETQVVNSHEEAQAYFDSLYANGYEGIILKPTNHKYSFKRSKDWIKVKAIKSADLLCVDIEEGTSKYEGMIGALVCHGIVEGKLVRVNVGSGLTDAQRSLGAYYVNKTIEVLYNEVIVDNMTGEHSLFLPRFNGERFDK